MDIDELDRKILLALTQTGRIRWSALADRLGVSAPAIADRVRRLETAGIITGYTAQLSAEALGVDLTAFVSVTLDHPQYRQGFVAFVTESSRVQSCHHVVGDADYLLKVRCWSTAALEHFLSNELKALPGIAQTRTTISLSMVKDSAVLPLNVDDVLF